MIYHREALLKHGVFWNKFDKALRKDKKILTLSAKDNNLPVQRFKLRSAN